MFPCSVYFLDFVWQLLYWKVSGLLNDNRTIDLMQQQFLLVDRRAKIQSGQRTTSFSWLLNDKRGAIGRMLSAIPEQHRMTSFSAGQFCV